MKKELGLFDEERIDDLGDLRNEELSEDSKEDEEEALAPEFDKAKESLKQAGTKTIDISKKVAIKATEVSKIIGSKALKKVQDEEFQENVIYYLITFLSWIARILVAPVGMLAYIFYITLSIKTEEREQDGKKWYGMHLLLSVVPTILILVTLFASKLFIVFLIPVILIEYYILIAMYGNNWSKRYSKKLGIINPFAIYFQNPVYTVQLDNDLETKIFGDSRSKNEKGSINTAGVKRSENMFMRKIGFLDCKDFSVKTDKLSDDYITEYGIVPRRVGEDVYYIKNGWAYQSVDFALGLINQNELIQMIKEDSEINTGFKEITKVEEHKKLKELILSKGISDKGIPVIEYIDSNSDRLLFHSWKVGDTLKGNDNYMIVRMTYRNGGNWTKAQKTIEDIKARTGYIIQMQKTEHQGSFNLLVLFKQEPDVLKVKQNDLQEYNDKNEIVLGNSLMGLAKAKWKQGKANHIFFSSGTDTGKTVATRSVIGQLVNLKDPIKEIYVSSGFKVNDYKILKEKGAFVEAGAESMYKMLCFLNSRMKEYETWFGNYVLKDANANEYNKVAPDDKKIPATLVVLEELGTALRDSDWGKLINSELSSMVAIARAYNCYVFAIDQVPLNDSIGDSNRLIQTRYYGSNEEKLLNSAQPDVAKFYGEYTGDVVVLYFFSSNKLMPEDFITYGKTKFIQIRTPYITDFNESIPPLKGGENTEEILNGTTDDASTSYASGLSDDDI